MARPWAVCCVSMPRSSTPRAPKLKNAQPFTRKVLAWYDRAERDLAWRHTRDPYRVRMREYMLQQTQVSRVTCDYPRFVERFPDLGGLAGKLVPKYGKRAWQFNQAMMELGALICVARKPKCPQCPVRAVCRTDKG